MAGIVAIVGRPNVGKSTLFNRLTGRRHAIVDDVSGVTRDRIYGTCDWAGRDFHIIDTGGMVPGSSDVFEAGIMAQVGVAIQEADIILFMVDVTTGITSSDTDVAQMLRRQKKPVVLIVNKVDNAKRELEGAEFYGLGFERTFFLSSISGSGTGELLDEVAHLLPKEEIYEDEDLPGVAIVGRPNVGKSSLINALIGEERNLVTEIAGTTRDAVHTRYRLFQKDFLLIDTAGIRKKSKVFEDLEFYSVIRAVKAMDHAHVCLLLVDARTGMQSQDQKIFGMIQRRRKGVVIVVNKWDLVEKDHRTHEAIEKDIRIAMSPYDDVPIVFTSVLQKQRIHKAVELALEVAANRAARVNTSVLNEWLQKTTAAHPPPAVRGKLLKIKYATQVGSSPPVIAFFCNAPKQVPEHYRRFLENRFRESFSMQGVPVVFRFREK